MNSSTYQSVSAQVLQYSLVDTTGTPPCCAVVYVLHAARRNGEHWLHHGQVSSIACVDVQRLL